MYSIITKSVKSIKTDYYRPENNKEFLCSLSKLATTIFPLEKIVVHKGSNQLIANGDYLQLAILEGKDEIEVVLVDFPDDYLIHAIVTHWKPTKKYSEMFKFIDVFMGYYSKKNGMGAQFRCDENPHSLRDFVATILGTNRTYLDQIEAIGKFNFELLNQVDSDETDLTLQEAFAMVPKVPKTKKGNGKGGEKGNGGVVIPMKNYTEAVTDLNSLSLEELTTLTNNLPSFLAEQIGNGILPDGLLIAKCFTYNETFQGFHIVYENDGKSVITYIAYTEDMRVSLLKAA